MAKLSQANSRRMYSWWWDGHISPKNSRWLRENLTDMDAKVNSMIKLVEQDADSFAKRAEMYYEKRPELMKMVEEFYRAYRALAERYDHATGALRQAHQTMTEVFPDQEPSRQNKDELVSYANENNPQTPFDDSFGHGDGRKFGVQRARNGLRFDEAEENDQNTPSVGKFEKEMQTPRAALAKFEAEKEFNLAYYKQSLEKLSHQELEFSNVQEEQANKAKDEVESLRKALKELEIEEEKSLVQYQKCLNRIEKKEGIISNAQKDVSDLNEQTCKAETGTQTLKLALGTMECEKATSLRHCKPSLEKILNLKNKLVIADDEAKKLNNRAKEAKAELETLKQALTVLGVDKDDAAVQYQESLDTISSLEQKVSCLQEEVQVLTWEVKSGVAKLKGAEEQSLHLEGSIQSLHSEMETLKLELGAQRDELTEKKREMGKLWTSVHEEQLRFVEAETSFQALQHSHHQTEEQLKSLALELQNMQSEILSLREAKEKLEEVELRADQRNALQQEFCLKEELNDVKNKYHATLDQVEAVGFNSEYFQCSVKDLQDENLNLKETQEKEIREKIDLLKKLENLEKFVGKNALSEKSLSDPSADLERSKEEIIAMEKSFQSLSEEKSTLDSEKASLATQLRVATENLEKLSEKNTILENAVSDAHNEIEGLKIRLSSIEDSRQLLENKKSDLINEKVTLVSQAEITRQKIDDIEKKYQELEKKHLVLEKERYSTLSEVEEVRLMVKESKLKEAKQMTEIANLHGKVVDMQKISVTLQEENLKLINEKISLVKDFLDLQEKNDTREGENISILGETATLSNLSLIFKNIINEVSRYQKNEIDLWESEATNLYSDLHTSSVSQALLEKKFHELTEALKSLEEEANSKDRVIQLLKERITTLEAENGDIGAQLAAYVPAISSLKDCISSLENSTCSSTQLRDNNDEIVKAAIENHVESHEEFRVDQKDMDILSELQQLEARVKAVTRIEELGPKGIPNQQNIKPLSVNSEFQNGLLTKDIVLDQISDCPSYGIGRKECISANSQSISFNSNITTPTKDSIDFESGVIVEKELGVDKLTIANRISLPNEELDKPKILESLHSDSQKLTNLQTIVWDLKRKAEMSEKTREDKSFGECKNVEQQLEKAEEDIMQLSDLTKKLMKSVDESDDVKDVVESEENRNLRRKFSEQARKLSERIGQLQLEVQEIQSIMLKLEDENGKEKNKRKSETSATKRTLLRNYLGLRTNNREKKRAFCGFVQPPTNED